MSRHPFERTPSQVNEPIPGLVSRFFYISPLAIDDPTATVPLPGVAGTKQVALPPTPFSEFDNERLERAWHTLQKRLKEHELKKEKERQRLAAEEARRAKQSLDRDLSRNARRGSTASTRVRSTQIGPGSRESSVVRKGSLPRDIISSLRLEQTRKRSDSSSSEIEIVEHPADLEFKASYDEHVEGTTGTPFIRAPSRRKTVQIRPSSSKSNRDHGDFTTSTPEPQDEKPVQTVQIEEPSITVPVGVSRLHQLTLPSMQMEPIYWSPVNDVASCIRATWFYKDSMLPVETDVSNMLEAGYLKLRPWTATWRDEIKSAIEAGASGEMKLVHDLWPSDLTRPLSRPQSAIGSMTESVVIDPDEGKPERRRALAVDQACKQISDEQNIEHLDLRASGKNQYGMDGRVRSYSTAQVIFDGDGRTAHLLRPKLQPSEYYGRRPLGNYIDKGRAIGVKAVRGFDQHTWDRLHVASNKSDSSRRPSLASLRPSNISNTPNYTDLVLVIHGIGQKLSERVETYSFTHAMNMFRRDVTAEVQSSHVQVHLRPDFGGVQILPVNWRSNLKFDGTEADEVEEAAQTASYSLSDITPSTLPSIRSLVSDVMLDIPYYLSHHQPKILAAVTEEANRVYKLWCKYNPGFVDHGRVHIIGHSLGSLIAIDVLSNQPTFVEGDMQKQEAAPKTNHFAFNTHNLFLCGSPASFFLLLRKGAMIPRRGRKKPDDISLDSTEVMGEAGSYGCLAVDNVYNIMHPHDPISYQFNATIDSLYAKMLKPALLPSPSTSWFGISNPFRAASSANNARADRERPSLAARLPSTVELETHNFSREELAEKRAFLLNDNGQIDFYMRSGGPFEFQYWTMLSAHSSYWLSRDVWRFLAIETGRRPGPGGALGVLKAVKRKEYARQLVNAQR